MKIKREQSLKQVWALPGVNNVHDEEAKKTLPFIMIILMAFAIFSSCNNDDDGNTQPAKVNYSGSFAKSSNEVTTSATGTATATFDPGTLELSYSFTWSGLGSNAASMHFHDNGPIIYPIEGFPESTSGSVSDTIMLTQAQATDLAAGKIYAQIHTVNYPGGEVIARLTKTNPSPGGGGGGGY